MSAYSDKVMADGASHYWRLSQPSGAFTDLVGTAHGTATAGTIGRGVAGALGGGGDSDGAVLIDQNTQLGAYITTPSLALPVPGSIEAWVKIPVTPTGVTRIFWTNRNGSVTSNPFLGINTQEKVEFGASAGTVVGSPAINDNQFHHVVATVSATTMETWVDGVLSATRAFALPAQTAQGMAFGWDNFIGVCEPITIDDLAMYARVLTPAEILNHYTLGTTVAGPSLPRDLNTGLYTYLLGVFGLSGGTSYAERVRADGASNHWRLGETAGTVAIDAIGGANGTISGGVTLNQPSALVDGNPAMLFNGTTGKILTPATAIRTPCTIEGWIKTTQATGVLAQFSTPYSGTVEEWALTVVNGLPAVNLSTAGQAQIKDIAATITVTNGAWRHIVWTFEATAVKCYIDGVLNKTDTTPWALVGMTLACEIGYRSDGVVYWNGSLDDVSIYPRALTANEVAAHYTLGRSGLSGGNDLTTLITRYLATLTGDMTARWKQMEKNAGF